MKRDRRWYLAFQKLLSTVTISFLCLYLCLCLYFCLFYSSIAPLKTPIGSYLALSCLSFGRCFP